MTGRIINEVSIFNFEIFRDYFVEVYELDKEYGRFHQAKWVESKHLKKMKNVYILKAVRNSKNGMMELKKEFDYFGTTLKEVAAKGK